ncbi:MAG: GHKL domain-containing protein [Deltaproteobacteria bacterium]|nr:GHKL domain-containing protein [Deltaproteobacteria bacterium]
MTLGKLKRTQMELVQSEKMASLGQLLAGVAHEINNPTTFIYSNLGPLKDYLGYLRNALKSDAPKYRNEMTASDVLTDLEALTNNIEEGAQRTKQIVSDLRRFGHSQDEVIQEVSVLEGIQGTLNILKHTWSDRIKIHVVCPSDLTVHANPGQLSQVWMNLLTNAIQAIKGEGEIWVTGKRERGKIVISVKDTGCGIASADLKRIFDPFFTTKEQGEGTGLGLSIVQQILKKFGGTIDVKSESGRGSEFDVTFPAS